MKAKNIYEMIEDAVRVFHGKPAISYKENKVLVTRTYEEVYADIRKMAVWLEKHHWTGKKVALVGAMDYEWAIATGISMNSRLNNTKSLDAAYIFLNFNLSHKSFLFNLSGKYLSYILSLSHHPDTCHSGLR